MEDKKYATRSAVKSLKSDANADNDSECALSRMRVPVTPTVGIPALMSPPPLSELTPASASTVRAPHSVCSNSSRVSRSEREARRLRAEYDAEVEITRLRENVVKKRLALEMAELAAQEEAEDLDDRPRSVASGPPGHVEWWLKHSTATAAVATERPAPALPAPAPAPALADVAAAAAAAAAAPTDIERLADAIGKLARNKPLPRQLYEIPTFDGNPAEWLGFEKAYRSTTEIHQFRPYENIARLRVALIGKAKAAVDDLMRTSSDPEEIIEALQEEFGHPAQLLECVLQRVRELPKVSESGRELRSFTNVVRNCISVLNTVRADGYLNSPQLVREVIGKLTPHQRTQYGEFAMRKEQENTDVDLRVSPNMKIVLEFLTQITRVASYTLDASQYSQSQPLTTTAINGRRDKGGATVRAHQVHTQVENVAATAEDKDKNQCSLCTEGHNLSGCEQFKQLTVEERWEFVKKNRICFKCINKTHSSRFCRAKRCNKCQWSHHELLHPEVTTGGTGLPPSLAPPPITPPPPSALPERTLPLTSALPARTPPPALAHTDFETVTNVGELRTGTLLKVVRVTIVTKCGEERSSYALLDDGASVSLIDESIVRDVDGPVVPLRLMTARGQCSSDMQSRSVQVLVRGPNGVSHDICVRTMRSLDLPSQTLPARVFEENAHLRHLDCGEVGEVKPMVLLGQDYWQLIVGREIRQGKSGRPVASLTLLGWVVHGPLGPKISSPADGVSGSSASRYDTEFANCMSTLQPDLHDLVKAQFELEAIGISQVPRKNDSTERALRILDSTSRRVSGGWEVGLLWNRDDVEMPDSYRYACRRLAGIERKMERDPEFANAYTKQVDRLVSENYARKVDGGIKASPVWYLPHFGVTNPNKPGKLRLVFDAAATFDGTSLNDNLLCGPDLLNSLMGVLIKFRVRKIAFTADIADMFMRVKIRDADQGAQLFLWREPRHRHHQGNDLHKGRVVGDPDIYAMNVMIFGATSSPTSAIYILNKNAEEFKTTHPVAVDAIKHKHYVDDYLDSADSVEAAEQLISDVTHIHRAGGFDIRGWMTNSPELREKLPSVVPGRVKIDRSEGERTLGMIWCPASDSMKFDLSFKRLPTDLIEGRVTPTKRDFLRFIMSIFDPLGLVYPCVIQSRVLMQRVWQSGISWDECIRDSEASTWFQWLEKLKALTGVAVPRWYGLQLTNVDLHVFGDASEKAYAAVAYLVGTNESGDRVCTMVVGKARVAPVKVVSIPRLELQAAVLACRLAMTVKSEIDITISNEYLWTDSKTVLMWINSDARDYQKYVSHRLAEIDNITKRSDWHWVPSESNPADEATRMDWPNNKGMWLSGPPFLCDPQVPWPTCATDGGELPANDPERIERTLVATEAAQPLIDVTRFSTWTRAIRVTAYVLVFVRTCRAKRSTAPGVAPTVDELREAEAFLLREAQACTFRDEVSALREHRGLPRASRLIRLDPMLYEDGLLRVRGRLSASTVLSFEEKHPIILDGKCATARLLIYSYHLRALHANHETVVNNVRERFWITCLRPTVKAVVARCQYCRVQRARPSPPKMADLPPVRLTTTRRAFVNCGVDYFGPMEVTIGRRREKRWGVLFTCLATRAVHLELAASLSSDSAILALRRLIARRGRPAVVLSDCGTNFVGANNELRAALRALDAGRLQGEALAKGIEWRFNPPAAPHMGGCWERLVRSVKSALRATLRERAPPEEVLHTVLLEAELVVNSRPLAYVALHPDQPTVHRKKCSFEPRTNYVSPHIS